MVVPKLICFFMGHDLMVQGRESYHPDYWHPEYEEYDACKRCKDTWFINEAPCNFRLRATELFEDMCYKFYFMKERIMNYLC